MVGISLFFKTKKMIDDQMCTSRGTCERSESHPKSSPESHLTFYLRLTVA